MLISTRNPKSILKRMSWNQNHTLRSSRLPPRMPQWRWLRMWRSSPLLKKNLKRNLLLQPNMSRRLLQRLLTMLLPVSISSLIKHPSQSLSRQHRPSRIRLRRRLHLKNL
jgi:hypothetical protein